MDWVGSGLRRVPDIRALEHLPAPEWTGDPRSMGLEGELSGSGSGRNGKRGSFLVCFLVFVLSSITPRY